MTTNTEISKRLIANIESRLKSISLSGEVELKIAGGMSISIRPSFSIVGLYDIGIIYVGRKCDGKLVNVNKVSAKARLNFMGSFMSVSDISGKIIFKGEGGWTTYIEPTDIISITTTSVWHNPDRAEE